VLSVHTVISFDFAVAATGWLAYDDLPALLRCGAGVYRVFAMVLNAGDSDRKFYHMEDLVTLRHLDNMAKVMRRRARLWLTDWHGGSFMAWYSATTGVLMMWNRMFGPMAGHTGS